MGRAMLGFAIEFSQLERELTAERVRASYQARAERGLWTGGVIPFGLDATDKKGHLIVNTAKQVIINEIFDILINKAGYLTKAVEMINFQGFYRDKEKPWDKKSLANLIRNKAMVGLIEINLKNKEKNSYQI